MASASYDFGFLGILIGDEVLDSTPTRSASSVCFSSYSISMTSFFSTSGSSEAEDSETVGASFSGSSEAEDSETVGASFLSSSEAEDSETAGTSFFNSSETEALSDAALAASSPGSATTFLTRRPA